MTYTTLQRRTDSPGFFWTPPDEIDGKRIRLFGAEAKHAKQVCRISPGDLITVCDGEGNAHDCEVTSATARQVYADIVRSHRRLGEPIAQVALAVGVGRPAVFDWIVEKSVELGVCRIIPIRTHRSPAGIGGREAAKRRVDRWRRLSLSAMKQSLRSVRPPVDDIAGPHDVASQIGDFSARWIADAEGSRLTEPSQYPARAIHALVIVGPESGFTTEERKMFIDGGAQPVTLGDRRLRAETAALTALTLVLHSLGEL